MGRLYVHFPRVVLALLWAVQQNDYFGWHAFPKTDAELIADGITFLLLALAFVTTQAGKERE